MAASVSKSRNLVGILDTNLTKIVTALTVCRYYLFKGTYIFLSLHFDALLKITKERYSTSLDIIHLSHMTIEQWPCPSFLLEKRKLNSYIVILNFPKKDAIYNVENLE